MGEEENTCASAPRITQHDIDNVIGMTAFFALREKLPVPFKDSCTTICVIKLRNGFEVIGMSSCASPENYDFKIGCDLAYKDAESKVWALEGYRLKQHLHDTATELQKQSQTAVPAGNH